MPERRVNGTLKHQIIIKELQSINVSPTYEEQQEPAAQTVGAKWQKPKPYSEEVWVETDSVTSSSKEVVAGLLRAKANELDPPKAATRSYGD
jgi:hypothetical protein